MFFYVTEFEWIKPNESTLIRVRFLHSAGRGINLAVLLLGNDKAQQRQNGRANEQLRRLQ